MSSENYNFERRPDVSHLYPAATLLCAADNPNDLDGFEASWAISQALSGALPHDRIDAVKIATARFALRMSIETDTGDNYEDKRLWRERVEMYLWDLAAQNSFNLVEVLDIGIDRLIGPSGTLTIDEETLETMIVNVSQSTWWGELSQMFNLRDGPSQIAQRQALATALVMAIGIGELYRQGLWIPPEGIPDHEIESAEIGHERLAIPLDFELCEHDFKSFELEVALSPELFDELERSLTPAKIRLARAYAGNLGLSDHRELIDDFDNDMVELTWKYALKAAAAAGFRPDFLIECSDLFARLGAEHMEELISITEDSDWCKPLVRYAESIAINGHEDRQRIAIAKVALNVMMPLALVGIVNGSYGIWNRTSGI